MIGNLTRDGKANATCPGTDGKYAYAWDAENRLVAVAPVSQPVSGDKMLAFKYDYRGRRAERTYAIHNGSTWVTESVQRFVYDEWNVVLVLDDNNDTVRKYTWGLDLSRTIHGAGGIGGLLAVEETAEQGSPAYWFLYDANGNVGQAIKASDQSIAAKYEYDPYGNVVSQSYSYADVNPIRFSTKWFDTELAGSGVNGAVGTSGLGYWGYRYYSPRLGRWVSRDPIEEAGSINMYRGLSNDPGNHVDPDGNIAWGPVVWWCVRIGGGWVCKRLLTEGHVNDPNCNPDPELPGEEPPPCPAGMFDCPEGCSYVPCDKQDCLERCIDDNCPNPYDINCRADCVLRCQGVVWE